MDFSRAMDVPAICMPVFAVIGLGAVLARRGRLDDGCCAGINWMVYHLSLPALIFTSIAGRPLSGLFDPALIVAPLGALLAVAAASMLIVRLFRLTGGLAATCVFGTFWANATYLGLPLCANAFGEQGVARAAAYNAGVVPFFILFGYLLIGFYSGEQRLFRRRMQRVVFNPVMLAAVAGIAVSWIAFRRFPEGGSPESRAAGVFIRAAVSFLKLIGSMGLPLALLAVGATLARAPLRALPRAHLGVLIWTVGCKLIVLPLLTLLMIRCLYPAADPVSAGTAVLLSATPLAAACYVISSQTGLENGLVASMLVISTALSVLTIPVWIFFVA